MTKKTSGLTVRAREFVGLGASVGAGCHPCVTHHVGAGTAAGIDLAGLSAAIAAAERVTADSAQRMAHHARRQLPPAVGPVTGDDTVREATLAALGAAVAANSIPNIERYLSEAAELGVSHDELVEAVSVAHEVQANAARIHAARTAELLETAPQAGQPAVASTCDATCPCHDDGTPGSTGGQEPAAEQVSSAAGGGAGAIPVAGYMPPQAMLGGCCGAPTA